MKKSFYKIATNPIIVNLKLGFTFFVFLSLINQSYTQPNNFSYTIYNKSSGLSLGDEVADVKIDSKGTIWVVTFSGVYKYTGERFSKINTSSIFHNSFIKFYETEEHQAFIIDVNGAIYFVNSDSLIAFTGNDSIRDLSNERKVVDIGISKDSIAISLHDKGLFQFNISDGQSTTIPAKTFERGFTFLFRKNKRPIIIRNKYHLGNNFPLATIADWKNPSISSVELDPPKTWFNNSTLQLEDKWLFSTGEGQLFEITESGEIREISFKYPILNLFKDSHNSIWISTYNNGVFIYKSSDTLFIEPKRILENETFIITAEDNIGNIWGYSEKYGVLKIYNPIFNINAPYDLSGISPQIQSIEFFNELLFFSSLSGQIGFQNLDSNAVVFFDNNNKAEKDEVDLKYFEKENRVYFSSAGKLGYCNESLEPKTLFSSTIKTFLGGRNIFFANSQESKSGLIGFYRDIYFTLKNDSISSISKSFETYVRDIFAFKDSIFIATDNKLILESNGQRFNFLQRFPELGNNVVDMKRFGKKIWISTLTGLYVIHNQNIKQIDLLNISPTGSKMIKEDEQKLWVFGNEGSFLIDSESNFIGLYQKLPDIAINDLGKKEGSLFIASKMDGVLNVSFDDLRKFPIKAPKNYISKLMIGSKDYTSQIDSTIELSYYENSIHLEFFSVNYSSQNLSYRYRIAGLDTSWIYTELNKLDVFGVPAGNYELELQSRIGKQLWGKPSKISFSIVPPIWQRGWFITGVVLIIILLSIYFIRLRISVVRREESLIISRLKSEQKALRTRMDPHFMFNIISSLQYLILKKKNDDASLFLNRFALIMRNSLKQTESDKISLEDEIQFLKEYIELEKMRFENHFNFSVEIDDSIDQKTMIPTFLIQPLVENSIKHGFEYFNENITIKVKFKLLDNFLIVEVEDDGLGYNKSIERKADVENFQKESYGLSTIKERIELYNGKIKKESFELIDLKNTGAKKSGTLVRIRIKLN